MSEYYNINTNVILEQKNYINVYTVSPIPPYSSTIWNYAKQVKQQKLSPFQSNEHNCLIVLCDREKNYCRTREELMNVVFELAREGFRVNEPLTKIYTRNGNSIKNVMVIEKN